MFTRFKKSAGLLVFICLAGLTLLSFQNCNRFESLDSSSALGSALTLSQKGDGFLEYCAAGKSAVLNGVNISVAGGQETVWTSPSSNNVSGPIPDGTTTAYRDAQGKVSMLIVHSDLYRITGDSLNNLNPNSTEVIFRSQQSIKESDYNHRHWLMAPYSLDGKNFVGVNHHEWYACKVKGDCNDDYQVIMRSWANSLTKTVSSDGGNTWSVPANHVVVAPPTWDNKPYNTAEINNHGIFHPTKIVREGNYYYLFAFASTSRHLPVSESYHGMIILRTADFNSWQHWTGGSNYADVSSGQKPKIIPGMDTVLVSLTYNASLCAYMAVFTSGDMGRGAQAVMFKLTASLANPQWTEAKEITGTRRHAIPSNHFASGFIVNNYPSVLDPFSAGYNFEISGSNPYLYFNSVGADPYVRNVYRLPLKIEGTGVVPSTPPPGTPQPPPGTNPGSTPPPVTPPPVTPPPATGGGSKVAPGLFSVADGIYFSNGVSYCYFTSFASYSQITGKNSTEGVLVVAALPTGMKSDGACKGADPIVSVPTSVSGGAPGLFMVSSGIYYSNGTAYCYFPSMDSFVAKTGMTSPDGIVRLSAIPSKLRNDGACQ